MLKYCSSQIDFWNIRIVGMALDLETSLSVLKQLEMS